MANIHQGFPTPSFSTVVDISANFLAGPIAVQETGIKTFPKKKKYKTAKWLSEEALQIVEKRRETKGKGEKEIYTHLNAEF